MVGNGSLIFPVALKDEVLNRGNGGMREPKNPSKRSTKIRDYLKSKKNMIISEPFHTFFSKRTRK